MSQQNLLDLLNRQGINHKKVASTNGDEYHSECPYCHDRDDFICWPNEPRPNCVGAYYCRQCGKWGDTIQFRRDFNGESFKEAMEFLGNAVPAQNSSYASTAKFKPLSFELPKQEWRGSALAIAEWAHEQIFKYPNAMSYLEKRGITLECIRRFKIGYCPMDCYFERHSWGLEPELNENGNPKKVRIPKGIVIPTYDSDGSVLRLKIRRDDWREGDGSKYVNVSSNTKVFSFYGDRNKDVMVVVESELDAITIAFYAGDFCFAVAAGSNITNPDPMTSFLADKIQYLLICHDNDVPGRQMRDKWLGLYPKAQPCPTPKGKDIGEAIEQGININDWLTIFLNRIGCRVRQASKINDADIQAVKVAEHNIDIAITHLHTEPASQDLPSADITQHQENAMTSQAMKIDKPIQVSDDDEFQPEDKKLIDWFFNEKQLPINPFCLSVEATATDPLKFYESLKASIARGPRDCRARTGALQGDIRKLRRYMNLNKQS